MRENLAILEEIAPKSPEYRESLCSLALMLEFSDRATTLLEQCLRAFDELGGKNSEEYVNVLFRYGKSLKNATRAIEVLKECQEVAEKLSLHTSVAYALILSTRGSLLDATGHHSLAVEPLTKSYDLMVLQGRQSTEDGFVVLNNLVVALHKSRQYDAAKDRAVEWLQLQRNAGRNRMQHYGEMLGLAASLACKHAPTKNLCDELVREKREWDQQSRRVEPKAEKSFSSSLESQLMPVFAAILFLFVGWCLVRCRGAARKKSKR